MALTSWLKFGAIWAIFVIFAIIGIAVTPSLNNQVYAIKNNIITNLSIEGMTKNPLLNIKANSAYNLLNFLLSYASFQGIFALDGFSLFKFWALDLYIFLPIFGIISAGTGLFVLILLLNVKSPHWKWNIRLKVGKLCLWIGAVSCYIALFLGLFLISITDNSHTVNGYKEIWYGTNIDDGVIHWTNRQPYQPNVFSIFGIIMNQNGLDGIFNLANGAIKAGAIFLVFLTPISLTLLVIGLALRMAISILMPSSSSYRGNNQFLAWLRFINISTKKELRARMRSNIGMIVLGIGFAVIMIFPAFISTKKYVATNYILLVISILLMAISLIPIYFMWYRLSQLQQFSYNLLMFLQMLIWLVIGLIWQILMWTEFKAFFQFPAYVPIITIFFFVNILIISFAMLVKGYRS